VHLLLLLSHVLPTHPLLNLSCHCCPRSYLLDRAVALLAIEDAHQQQQQQHQHQQAPLPMQQRLLSMQEALHMMVGEGVRSADWLLHATQ
jgi:hypothetical protein